MGKPLICSAITYNILCFAVVLCLLSKETFKLTSQIYIFVIMLSVVVVDTSDVRIEGK